MRGHIQKRGKESWRLCISLGKGPDGKYKYHYKTVHGTKTEAEKQLAELLVEINNGELLRRGKDMTVESFMTHWLEDFAKEQYEPNTYAFYKSLAETHIIPALGRIPLQELESIQIQQFYGQLLKSGRQDGKSGGLSPSTVRHIHATLSSALSYAVDHRLVRSNPCRNAKVPSTHRSKRKVLKVWTPEEAAAVLQAANCPRWRYGIYFSLVLNTGLRVNEALALRWENVDLNNKVIRVQEAIKNRKVTDIELGPPKSEAGIRPVTISKELVELLKKHRIYQLKEKLAMGSSYTDNDLVIASAKGNYVNVSNIKRTMNCIVRATGVPSIPLKNLRHTHATLLLLAGVHPKTVQERLGHSDIKVTLEKYSFVLPSLQTEVAATFTNLINNTRKKTSKKTSEKTSARR